MLKLSANLPTIPCYYNKISAGFPSPEGDTLKSSLDLNKLLIKHESSTFFMQVKGEAMKDAGIWPGDILIVDRSLSANHGKTVVVTIGEELFVRRLYKLRNKILLMSANKDYAPIEINNEIESMVWGVVDFVIHKV